MENFNLMRIFLKMFVLFVLLYLVCGMDILFMVRKFYKKVSDV